MTLSLVFVLFGFIGAVMSIGIFIYLLLMNNNAQNTKIIYSVIVLIHGYMAIIYGSVLFGIIAVTAYGNFVRPVLFLIMLFPAYVALLHRKHL